MNAKLTLVIIVIVYCNALWLCHCANTVPNASTPRDSGGCTSENDIKNCDANRNQELCATKVKERKEWKPFKLSSNNKWISMERLIENYVTWHDETLKDTSVPCNEKKIIIFTPSAGLGDSIGALTTAFFYALKSGRLFFMDWKPHEWTVGFKDLPFAYNYDEVIKMTDNVSGESLICPNSEDETTFLRGHITNEHPIVALAIENELLTEFDKINEVFLKPSSKVQKVIHDITKKHFDNGSDDIIVHKVAMVMRTGIGEYNQFLSKGDEKNFVKCFLNYAKKFRQTRGKNQQTKFVVFVTSDDQSTKQSAVKELHKNKHSEYGDIEVVSLEDSAIHVMHLEEAESKKKKTLAKLRKTFAEFFIIGDCDARFLTHGSLFGRVAAERLGYSPKKHDFYISDSMCDKQREKYSYLQCHSPKYPDICGFK